MNPAWPVDYLVPALLLLAAVALFAAWRSAADLPLLRRLGLCALRGAALALIALIALNPGEWIVPETETDSEWVILLDRSGSMQIDDGEEGSRWDRAVAAATAVRAGDERPERVRIHPFSADLEVRVTDPAELAHHRPDGTATDIYATLGQLVDDAHRAQRPLDGVLLFSDGRQTINRPPPGDPAVRARALGAPIYAVTMGGDVRQRDLSLHPVRRHYIGFAGQELRIQARVRNDHLGDIRPEITLHDPDGQRLQAQSVWVADNEEALVEFEVSADEPGYAEYDLRAPDWPGEVSVANNRFRVAATFLDERIRVLMVEGVPHWDSKFLLQLLRAQPHINVTTAHRVTGERFFLTEMDEDLSEAGERAVFPETLAELNTYDIVVFGKGAEYFLNPDRIQRLRHFVEERGGVILYARSKPYAGTFPELAALEPLAWGDPVQRPFRWQPTTAADDSGLFGVLLPDRRDPLWERLPTAEMAHRVHQLKPFTQVWIEGVFTEGHTEEPIPIMAARRLGQGLSVVINAEELWRWSFIPEHEHAASWYQQFWPLVVQWMAIQSDFLPGRRYALQLSHSIASPGTAVQATIRMRDQEGTEQPAPPRLRISRGDAEVRTQHPQQTGPASGPGARPTWTTVFTLNEPGTYRIATQDDAVDEDDAAHATLQITAPPDEMMDVRADPAFLERLTTRSGGRVLALGELDQVLEQFRPEQHAAEVADPVWSPYWDRAWIALLFTALLAGDWFLRRRNGMM